MRYKTVIGLNENIVGAITYVGFWITGVIFLLIERNNKYVRFHAMQSLLLFLPLTLLMFIVAWAPYIGWLAAEGISFLSMFLLLLMAFMSYRGDKFKLPIVGKYAYKYIYGEK